MKPNTIHSRISSYILIVLLISASLFFFSDSFTVMVTRNNADAKISVAGIHGEKDNFKAGDRILITFNTGSKGMVRLATTYMKSGEVLMRVEQFAIPGCKQTACSRNQNIQMTYTIPKDLSSGNYCVKGVEWNTDKEIMDCFRVV